jgi:hypothetical protein
MATSRLRQVVTRRKPTSPVRFGKLKRQPEFVAGTGASGQEPFRPSRTPVTIGPAPYRRLCGGPGPQALSAECAGSRWSRRRPVHLKCDNRRRPYLVGVGDARNFQGVCPGVQHSRPLHCSRKRADVGKGNGTIPVAFQVEPGWIVCSAGPAVVAHHLVLERLVRDQDVPLRSHGTKTTHPPTTVRPPSGCAGLAKWISECPILPVIRRCLTISEAALVSGVSRHDFHRPTQHRPLGRIVREKP